jgi:hypothetical protein
VEVARLLPSAVAGVPETRHLSRRSSSGNRGGSGRDGPRWPIRSGSVRFGSVRSGSVRFGPVRFGSVRFGQFRSLAAGGPVRSLAAGGPLAVATALAVE